MFLVFHSKKNIIKYRTGKSIYLGKNMANFEDDLDQDEEDGESRRKIDRKKILVFLLPALIVIGLVVSFYSVFNQKLNSQTQLSYSVVEKPATEENGPVQTLVLYDMPEINVKIRDAAGDAQSIKMRLNIELDNAENVRTVEALMPKIIDTVIAHTVELTPDEISGANGLYWLKEELLYRINLIVDPIVVSNLNFKTFEINKEN